MFANSRNLLATAVSAVVLAAALDLGIARGALQVMFGLALLLILPGYAWVEALFPLRALRAAERVTLSLGLSLALAIVGGLLLNITLWGLRAGSWAVLSACIVLTGVFVALLRHAREVGLPALVERKQPMRAPEAALFGLALLLVTAAGVIGLRAAAQQEITDFTQLWLEQSGPAAVQVSMASLEAGPEAYRLEIRVGSALYEEWSRIQLQPGARWQTTVAIPALDGGRQVQALLYRLDDPDEPYRSAEVWMAQTVNK